MPSAVSEQFFAVLSLRCLRTMSELIGYPISRSPATSGVRLELRPLPSPGITRLHRYYEPLRHPRPPGLSLAGVRLAIPGHGLGLPLVSVRFPCVHAADSTPVAEAGRGLRSSRPAISAFPVRGTGSACTSSFSRLARRSLVLRPARARGRLIATRYPEASAISLPPRLHRLLLAGAVGRVGLHPLESAALSRRTV